MIQQQALKDPTIELNTPEGVPLKFVLASRVERISAFVLDLFIIVFCFFALTQIFLMLMESIFLFILCSFVIRQGYFIFFELLWQGTTPGKRLVGIRVVARDGDALHAERVFARNLVRDVELFLPLLAMARPELVLGIDAQWLSLPALGWVFIIGLLPFFNKERARPGDLLAGTVVIKLPRAVLKKDQADSAPEGEEIGFTKEQLAIYGEHELETLAAILRTTDLRKVHRKEMRDIAKAIAKKIQYTGTEHNRDPVRFLKSFYAAQRTSLEQRLMLGERKVSKKDPPKT